MMSGCCGQFVVCFGFMNDEFHHSFYIVLTRYYTFKKDTTKNTQHQTIDESVPSTTCAICTRMECVCVNVCGWT